MEFLTAVLMVLFVQAMAFGTGKHMGCDVSWAFIWRPDGAFYEEVIINTLDAVVSEQ